MHGAGLHACDHTSRIKGRMHREQMQTMHDVFLQGMDMAQSALPSCSRFASCMCKSIRRGGFRPKCQGMATPHPLPCCDAVKKSSAAQSSMCPFVTQNHDHLINQRLGQGDQCNHLQPQGPGGGKVSATMCIMHRLSECIEEPVEPAPSVARADTMLP